MLRVPKGVGLVVNPMQPSPTYQSRHRSLRRRRTDPGRLVSGGLEHIPELFRTEGRDGNPHVFITFEQAVRMFELLHSEPDQHHDQGDSL